MVWGTFLQPALELLVLFLQRLVALSFQVGLQWRQERYVNKTMPTKIRKLHSLEGGLHISQLTSYYKGGVIIFFWPERGRGTMR